MESRNTENITDELLATNIQPISDVDSFFSGGDGYLNEQDNFVIVPKLPEEDEKEEVTTAEAKEQVEDKGDIVTTPEKVEGKEDTKDTGTDNIYTSFYNELVKSNVIENVIEEGLVTEDEEGNEVPLGMNNLSMELLVDIIKDKVDSEVSSIKESSISKEGLSETTLKLIELDRNGGDIQEALKIKRDFINPMESLDFTKEDDLKQALYIEYSSLGLKDADIRRIIDGYTDSSELEEKALEAKEKFDKLYKDYLDKSTQAAINAKKEREEKLRVYKKSLSENLKKYQLNDSYKKKIVDITCRMGQNGQSDLDLLYQAKRDNAEDAAELALFLINKEEYIKQVTSKALKDEKVNTYKKLKVIKRRTPSPNPVVGEEPSEEKEYPKNYITI